MCGGMQLLPDPLYSLPTDNTYLLTITSTDNGRIFLAGKDGCLYEVAYQVSLTFILNMFFPSLLMGCGLISFCLYFLILVYFQLLDVLISFYSC